MASLESLENIPGEVLTAAQIAPVLKMDPNTIRWQAIEDPGALGFPVIVTGHRVTIPKRPFINFMMGG